MTAAYFAAIFCAEEFQRNGLAPRVAQANVSENVHAFTLRGFHYQLRPHGEDKTLSCLKGRVYDIVVNVREESPTFMKWFSCELDDTSRLSLHVPAGSANAFLTLVDGVLVQYYCSHPYTVAAERGIRFNDPAFGFVWPQAPAAYLAEGCCSSRLRPSRSH